MILYEDALKKALEYLQGSEVALGISHQEEFSGGWLFCFQTEEYLKTGNPSAQLAGNGPFIIDKDTGELHFFGTDSSPSEYMEKYLQDKNNCI
ncbi:hypothetical protein HU746_06450 [Pseudomonas lurida]|uniref:YrhB domain-containing protein n=1 Tax=Pseudomonas lurida TaxID=244566 RepID=UPI001648E54C|nr:YrhB domain-containing protein [Pseudomonas lurida]MBC3244289.1 hypothetical protein [Pseudomonas lurida]